MLIYWPKCPKRIRNQLNKERVMSIYANHANIVGSTMCISVIVLIHWYVHRLWRFHNQSLHDDIINWKYFPRYWSFVRGIHQSPVNSPHKGQWRGALMFSLICAWINGWVNNREAGDFSSHRAHYDVVVMNYRRKSPIKKMGFMMSVQTMVCTVSLYDFYTEHDNTSLPPI